jgi:hypothetical protein
MRTCTRTCKVLLVCNDLHADVQAFRVHAGITRTLQLVLHVYMYVNIAGASSLAIMAEVKCEPEVLLQMAEDGAIEALQVCFVCVRVHLAGCGDENVWKSFMYALCVCVYEHHAGGTYTVITPMRCVYVCMHVQGAVAVFYVSIYICIYIYIYIYIYI